MEIQYLLLRYMYHQPLNWSVFPLGHLVEHKQEYSLKQYCLDSNYKCLKDLAGQVLYF